MSDDDLSTQARELVERYRRSVHAMSGEHSAEVAASLARALHAVERARTRETLSDDEAAALAVRAAHSALDSTGDPF
jgi:alpha-D-ribose 1-methylphosphonate 5-triphosphate synthase subunit PhnI